MASGLPLPQTRRMSVPVLQVGVEANTPSTFDHVVLSSDGKLIAAAVGGSLYLLDAFQGAVKARFATGRPDQASAGFEPSFSPDSQYLSSGAEPTFVSPSEKTYPLPCFVLTRLKVAFTYRLCRMRRSMREDVEHDDLPRGCRSARACRRPAMLQMGAAQYAHGHSVLGAGFVGA